MRNHKSLSFAIILSVIMLWVSVFTASANETVTYDVNGGLAMQGILCEESVVGFCGEGYASGDIYGEVFIVLDSVSFLSATKLAYTATIEISAPGGTLSGTVYATNEIIEFGTGGQILLWENLGTYTFTDGTGIYNGWSGELDIVGTIDEVDFETDNYTGTLTAPNNGNNAANGNRGSGNNGQGN